MQQHLNLRQNVCEKHFTIALSLTGDLNIAATICRFNEKTDMVILDGAAVEGCSLVNLLHKHEVAVETHFGQYLKLINFVMLYRL